MISIQTAHVVCYCYKKQNNLWDMDPKIRLLWKWLRNAQQNLAKFRRLR